MMRLTSPHQVAMLSWALSTGSATPDENLNPPIPLASGAEVLWPRTEAAGVADAMIEAGWDAPDSRQVTVVRSQPHE
jgi:hypothetical protein